MKKLFFVPILSFGLTTYPDFSLCYKKYKNYTLIPISKNYSITSKKPSKFIKYDEDLGIYLVKKYNKHYLHFKKSHLGVWLASINKKSIYSGNYAQYQTSLYTPAQLSTKTKVGDIVSDIFCNPIGIGVKGGFLSKKFINYFIKAPTPKKDLLKFVGIIFNDKLIITKILPNSVAQRHYIKTNTKIVKIDGVKVKSKKDIANLLNNNHKDVTITIKQDGFDFTFKGKKCSKNF